MVDENCKVDTLLTAPEKSESDFWLRNHYQVSAKCGNCPSQGMDLLYRSGVFEGGSGNFILAVLLS